MAKTHRLFPFLAVFCAVFFTVKASYSPETHGQKYTHIHFYLHDVVSGKNPTAVIVAVGPSRNSSFGMTVVIDDLLTEGPDPKSKPVGRAQGMYASASQTETALLMNVNLVFTEGEYKGSTLSLFGRNSVMSAVREFPIVGGTGVFRFARGYVQAKTQSFNLTSGDAVLEYDVYVLH